MRTETLDVNKQFGEEYEGKYMFKEITWAKRSRIIQKYTKYNKLSGQVESSDFVAIQAETIMASLHGQPESKPLTLQKLLDEENGVPIGFGESLSKVTNKLNSVSREDLRFLLEQLDEESRIQLFQSFGYAKNSAGPSSNSEDNPQEKSNNFS